MKEQTREIRGQAKEFLAEMRENHLMYIMLVCLALEGIDPDNRGCASLN